MRSGGMADCSGSSANRDPLKNYKNGGTKVARATIGKNFAYIDQNRSQGSHEAQKGQKKKQKEKEMTKKEI